jgi:hypothetical protein
MIIHAVAWDKDDQPTLYRSNAVYTYVDDKRVLASQGFEAPTLQEIVSLVQHAEISFKSIWVNTERST